MKILALLSLLSLTAASAAPDPAPFTLARTIVTNREAFSLGPPELIAGPQVQNYQVSADGRYILLEQVNTRLTPSAVEGIFDHHAEPSSERSLILWDNATHLEREIKTGDSKSWSISQIEWMGGSDSAVALIRFRIASAGLVLTAPGTLSPKPPVEHQELIRITPAGVELIATLGAEDELNFNSSPVLPGELVEWTLVNPSRKRLPDGSLPPQRQQSIYFLSPRGPLALLTRLKGDQELLSLRWLKDGSPTFRIESANPGNQEADPSRYELNLRTGQLAPTQVPQEEIVQQYVTAPRDATSALQLGYGRQTLTADGISTTVNPLWLESREKGTVPRVLLSADASDGEILPDGTAALYSSEGALWMVPIAPLGKDAFRQLQIAEARTEAEQHAKMLGMALIMYSQDNDENFPTEVGFEDKIKPYLSKTEDLLTNFHYTPGPNLALSAIDSPAETEMGYVTGPGGSAVLYADGHVRWKNGP